MRPSLRAAVLIFALFFSVPVFAEETKPYNFVIFKTDDQRWDTLWAMPILKEKLMREGVTFTNAIVTSPACCPERGSFLAGGFTVQNTGVLTNDALNGAVQAFDDKNTLPVMLQRKGYKTALIGKYLNYYETITPYIPPGWSLFISSLKWRWSIRGESGPDAPSEGKLFQRPQEEITKSYADYAVEFLRSAGDAPFFLYFTPYHPHTPALPEKRDKSLFSDYVYRGRGYGEDVSDKPRSIIRNASSYEAEKDDEFHRNQLRSLQSVDRAVGVLIEELKRSGQWERTVFIFMSDNGLMWGEHGQTEKYLPYEESIRVPLVIAMPGVSPREDARPVAANLDLPATIIELSGVPIQSQGESLAAGLRNPKVPGRQKPVFIESFHVKAVLNWAGLRGPRYKYVEYVTGEKELYDLEQDPYENENQAANPQYAAIAGPMAEELQPQKGLTLNGRGEAPSVVLGGRYYFFQLEAVGGTPPYFWSMEDGVLPEGLSWNPAKARIVGNPARAGITRVLIQVTDSSVSPYHGNPQKFRRWFEIEIKPESSKKKDLKK
jgi:N-acetylglucosamine-6-sulfatase